MDGTRGARIVRVPERAPGITQARRQGAGGTHQVAGAGGVPHAVTVTAFIAAPVVHQGARVGNIFVGSDEPGREFTQEDEEILVTFASQAAQVIVNARRYRDEQRARAGLETLIDTSPVGVAVFDARTGAPASFNREAMRIVDGLRNPDQNPEELIESLTIRRADGREFLLMEFPLAEVLSTSETVRAEEIAMEAPDGRSVTVLLNATPIRSSASGGPSTGSGGGEMESVVVTMQDMRPRRRRSGCGPSSWAW